MMGTRSSGSATLAPLTSSAVLPKGACFVPIIAGTPNPDGTARTLEDVTIAPGGTSFPLSAVLGGAMTNLPAGTVLALDPPVPGLAGAAIVDAPGFVGGANAAPFGSVKQIRLYEAITPAEAESDLARAGASMFPALALIWTRSGTGSRAGRGVRHLPEEWTLAVISSRTDSDLLRRSEGLQILDEATEFLLDRSHVDGECFSSPAAVEIVGRERVKTSGPSYVYAIHFSTFHTIEKRDSRVFSPWTATEQSVNAAGAPPLAVIDQAGFTM
jgi:hypothetical protein